MWNFVLRPFTDLAVEYHPKCWFCESYSCSDWQLIEGLNYLPLFLFVLLICVYRLFISVSSSKTCRSSSSGHNTQWPYRTKKLFVSSGEPRKCLDPPSQKQNYIWMFPKIVGSSPQIIHFNRVFHVFHHPFWGFPTIFGNTQYKQNWVTKPILKRHLLVFWRVSFQLYCTQNSCYLPI